MRMETSRTGSFSPTGGAARKPLVVLLLLLLFAGLGGDFKFEQALLQFLLRHAGGLAGLGIFQERWRAGHQLAGAARGHDDVGELAIGGGFSDSHQGFPPKLARMRSTRGRRRAVFCRAARATAWMRRAADSRSSLTTVYS